MESYIDIQLLPDPEFPAATLMNALFSKLHRGLVAHGGLDIGISFPEASRRNLGQRLRLHGSAAALENLMAQGWNKGFHDHARLTPPTPVPAGARARVVRRVQAKSNPERERRRLSTRQGLTPAQALARIPDQAAETLDLPYLIVSSSSNGHQFRLFIEHGPIQDHPAPGRFNAYGLSPQATVPWF